MVIESSSSAPIIKNLQMSKSVSRLVTWRSVGLVLAEKLQRDQCNVNHADFSPRNHQNQRFLAEKSQQCEPGTNQLDISFLPCNHEEAALDLLTVLTGTPDPCVPAQSPHPRCTSRTPDPSMPAQSPTTPEAPLELLIHMCVYQVFYRSVCKIDWAGTNKQIYP